MIFLVEVNDEKKTVRVDEFSKLTKVEELRKTLCEHLNIDFDRHRLFCKGKQMVDGHTLSQYNVSLNEVIHVLIKPLDLSPETRTESADDKTPFEQNVEEKECESLESMYKKGDFLDALDETTGAWFGGLVTEVVKDEDASDENVRQDSFVYQVKLEGDDGELIYVTSDHLRPRACYSIPISDISVGDKVMVNYNCDEPTKRGYWYDAEITGIRSTSSQKEIFARVFTGKDLVPIEGCKVMFINEIFRVESYGTQKNSGDKTSIPEVPIRERKPECDCCLDNSKKKCKNCSRCICGDKKKPEEQIICDECNSAYHIYCLIPPLPSVPEEDKWYCPCCQLKSSNIAKAKENLLQLVPNHSVPFGTAEVDIKSFESGGFNMTSGSYFRIVEESQLSPLADPYFSPGTDASTMASSSHSQIAKKSQLNPLAPPFRPPTFLEIIERHMKYGPNIEGNLKELPVPESVQVVEKPKFELYNNRKDKNSACGKYAEKLALTILRSCSDWDYVNDFTNERLSYDVMLESGKKKQYGEVKSTSCADITVIHLGISQIRKISETRENYIIFLAEDLLSHIKFYKMSNVYGMLTREEIPLVIDMRYHKDVTNQKILGQIRSWNKGKMIEKGLFLLENPNGPQGLSATEYVIDTFRALEATDVKLSDDIDMPHQ